MASHSLQVLLHSVECYKGHVIKTAPCYEIVLPAYGLLPSKRQHLNYDNSVVIKSEYSVLRYV